MWISTQGQARQSLTDAQMCFRVDCPKQQYKNKLTGHTVRHNSCYNNVIN